MTLSEFIDNHIESLLRDWEAFAREAQPERADLDRDELRDWAASLLSAISAEMKTAQSDLERERKSRGARPDYAPALTEAAQAHAIDRLAQGFNIDQMVSEYRALRASVVSSWTRHRKPNGNALQELVRFDEALDQALTESIRRYSAIVERARDLFVGALGHDMRTPLGSILVTAEALLLSSDSLEGRHLQGAVRIRNAAKRISEMVKDLLDFTHTRLGGRLPVSREETDLATVLTTITEELRAIHPDRDIHLDCESELDGAFDPRRIGQLLSNLLSNAIRYGRQDAPVGIHARKTDDEVVITIHNEGDPIPQNLRRTMFEPLVRGRTREPLETRLPDGGLGLGLYIAQEIAEAHGGHVILKSSTIEGTTFEVRLRRYPPAATQPDGQQ